MSSPSREDEATSRWKAVIASAVDGILVIDSQGRIEAFNPAAERLFGYRESEILGQNVRILMPPPYRDEHDRYLTNYLESGIPKIIGKGREVTGLRRDGTTFPLHLSVGEMVVGGERKFTGILHDLSERVRIEGQLREQTALARLGEMAAVLAHEVKNPLAAIRAAVQTLSQASAGGGRMSDVGQQIVGRIDALTELMQELLLFARPPQPRTAQVALSPLIESTVRFVQDDPGLARVRIDVEGAAPAVAADPELLKIVLLNLLINSAQAMQGEGRIVVVLDAEAAMCRLTVRDSGPGIPDDLRDKIFQPFFTTKRGGTGLGLATARRLVEAHGGTIACDPVAGRGASVSLRLPLADAPARTSRIQSSGPTATRADPSASEKAEPV